MQTITNAAKQYAQYITDDMQAMELGKVFLAESQKYLNSIGGIRNTLQSYWTYYVTRTQDPIKTFYETVNTTLQALSILTPPTSQAGPSSSSDT